MARSWCKISVSLDSHPRIRKAGNLGRQVFEFVLRRNAELDRGGMIPAHHLDPEYLADVLMLDGESSAKSGIERCIRAGLLAPTQDGYAICGWDDDWAKHPMSDAERQRLSRASRGSAARAPEPAASSAAPSPQHIAPKSGYGSHDRAAELAHEHQASSRAPSAELAAQHQAREHAVNTTKHYDVTKCHDAIVTDGDGHECHTGEERRREEIRGDETQRESARAIASPGTRDHVRDHAKHKPCQSNSQAYPQTDWHRRNAIWNTLLHADEKVRTAGIDQNGLPPPKTCAGQNERNLADCMRQLAESFGPEHVDAKLAHVIAVYEDEAIGRRTRKWFRPATVFNPKTILDKASTPIGYWRQINGHGASPSSGRASGAIEAQLERVRQLEAEGAA